MQNLRERKKLKTREAIESASWRLFSEKGYDATTIEDIADAVNISSRTFFRYFDSKEAVMFGDWRGYMAQVEDLIEGRPAEESPMVALREAAVAMARMTEEEGERTQLHEKLVAKATKVGNYEREVVLPAMEEAFTGALARRIGVDPEADLRPAVLASMGLAVALTAKRRWIATGCRESYGDLVRQAFDIVCEAGCTG